MGKFVRDRVGVFVGDLFGKLLGALDGVQVGNSVRNVDDIQLDIFGPLQLPRVTLQRVCVCSQSVASGESQ